MGIIFSSFNGLEAKLPYIKFSTCQWQQKNFSDLFTILGNNTHSRAELTNCGTIKNIHYGDVLIKFGNILDTSQTEIPYLCENCKYKNEYMQDGDVIIADTAEDYTAGKCTELFNVGSSKIISGLHTIPCRPKIKFAQKYLGYYTNSPAYRHQLLSLLQGIKVYSISKTNLSNTHVSYPTLPEQQKIADFLSLVDRRIEKQRQLVESLKKYKRGLFLKLYNDSEKKSYKICDLGKYCATGALSKEDIDVSGKYPCILYGELFTKYGEVIKQVSSRTNIIPTYLSGTNEILFPSSTTADAQSLIFPSSLKIKNIFLGGDLFTIKLKNEFDSDFISYLVNFEYKNTLARYAQGITIIHLHYTDIKEQVIDIPNIDTQFNISSVMRKIEAIIEMNISELNLLLLMKKGFLQQMFI